MDLDRFNPGWLVINVFLIKAFRLDPIGMAMQRLRPIFQIGKNEGRYLTTIANQVALGIFLSGPINLVEISELEDMPVNRNIFLILVTHSFSRSCQRCLSRGCFSSPGFWLFLAVFYRVRLGSGLFTLNR